MCLLAPSLLGTRHACGALRLKHMQMWGQLREQGAGLHRHQALMPSFKARVGLKFARHSREKTFVNQRTNSKSTRPLTVAVSGGRRTQCSNADSDGMNDRTFAPVDRVAAN